MAYKSRPRLTVGNNKWAAYLTTINLLHAWPINEKFFKHLLNFYYLDLTLAESSLLLHLSVAFSPFIGCHVLFTFHTGRSTTLV